MFCPNCGTNAGDGAFCPNCGTKMPVLNQSQPAKEQATEPAQAVLAEPTAQVEPAVQAESTAQASAVQTEPVIQAEPAAQASAAQAEPVVQTEPVIQTEPTAQTSAVQTEPAVQVEAAAQADTAAQAAAATQETATAAEKKPQLVTNASDVLPPQNFTDIQPVKEKKKWPKVLGITAAIAVVLVAAVFLAWPLIEGIISPRAKAVAALKNASGNFEEMVNKYLDGEYTTASAENMKIIGDVEIKKMAFGGVDYTASLPAKHISLVHEISVDDQAFAGSIGLGKSASNSDLTINYYLNSSRFYFNIPALSSKSFYEKISSSLDYSAAGMLGGSSVSPEDLQKYAPALKAAVRDIMDGVDEFIEDLDYKTVGKDTYASDNGDIDVTVYDITIKEKMIKNLGKAVVTNVLDDKELSSYTSILGLMGMTKDSLLKEIDNANLNMPNIKFTLYVNKNKEIVKIILDMSQFGEAGEISIEFIGKETITDYVIMQITSDGTQLRFSVENAGNTATVKVDILPEQTGSKGEFVSMGISGSGSSDKLSYDSIWLRGKVAGEEFDFECSGSFTTGPLAVLSKSSSDFRNAIDLDNVTAKQRSDLQAELKKNSDVLKKVLPGALADDLTGN